MLENSTENKSRRGKCPRAFGTGHMEKLSRALGLPEEIQRIFTITTWHWFKLLLGLKFTQSVPGVGMVTHMAEVGIPLKFPFSK